ncbi:MAG: hypothetical protein R3335_08570 [Anaerolineales bacterium]|nr:hypothetical protein [Anaerolineales bacterium]
MHNERWEDGTLVARCLKARSGWPYTSFTCQTPDVRCACGIYAAAPDQERALRYLTTQDVFLALVRAHRKTIRHERGWRAGQAELVAVVQPEPYWYNGIYYPHEFRMETSLEAAWLSNVPLIELDAARALVASSWDYYRRRLQ